nr:VOC family protein [Mycobacterium sp. DL592]
MTPPAAPNRQEDPHDDRCSIRSVAAPHIDGAVVMPPEDQFWGNRYGMARDPFGHQWSLGQPVSAPQAGQ